ncbi:hypothetical protein ACIRQY_19175 [Streptomyces sp. NPDC101490]|uniref:hypothetical protein n=1 Tax=Streptomyces sp. NPDC101490 TaxID=3366143 RepID=UPI00380D1B96
MTGLTAVTLPAYVAEVYAEWPTETAYATAATRLAIFECISAEFAVRWLRGEARRLADRIDPAPKQVSWGPPRAFRPVTPSGPDCAPALRSWADSEPAATDVLEVLGTRHPFRAAFPDTGATYVLSIWLSTARTGDIWDLPAAPAAQRVGTLTAPLYADAP